MSYLDFFGKQMPSLKEPYEQGHLSKKEVLLWHNLVFLLTYVSTALFAVLLLAMLLFPDVDYVAFFKALPSLDFGFGYYHYEIYATKNFLYAKTSYIINSIFNISYLISAIFSIYYILK